MAAAANVFFNKDTPHGKVKRVMWFKYLQAFIAKTQQSRFIDQTIICDVFAGTGRYNQEWSTNFTDYGSPLVALRAAIGYFVKKHGLPNNFEPTPCAETEYEDETEDEYETGVEDETEDESEDKSLMLEEYKIIFNFVEKKKKYYKSLIENIILFLKYHGIGVLKTQQASKQVVVSSKDESFPIQCNIFNCKFTEFSAPDVPNNVRMATFIDPFGYKMIPWQHVSKFVGKHKEIFINLMTSFMNRFFKKHRDTIGKVFGIDPDVLQTLRNEEQSDFIDALAYLYAEKLELSDPENPNHVLTFEMRNKGNVRFYHLVFATSHIKGLKAMKESFNRGTQEPDTSSLSDYKILRKNIPLNLGNQQDDNAVADAILKEFKGRQLVSIKDIEMFVWLHTPYLYRKKPLKILEQAGEITVVNKVQRSRGTFPNSTEWLLSFASE